MLPVRNAPSKLAHSMAKRENNIIMVCFCNEKAKVDLAGSTFWSACKAPQYGPT